MPKLYMDNLRPVILVMPYSFISYCHFLTLMNLIEQICSPMSERSHTFVVLLRFISSVVVSSFLFCFSLSSLLLSLGLVYILLIYLLYVYSVIKSLFLGALLSMPMWHLLDLIKVHG